MSLTTGVIRGRTEVPFVTQLADHGDRPALITEQGATSYRELADHVDEAGHQLGTTRRLVLIAGANEPGALVTYLAAVSGGHPAILAPGNRESHLQALIDAYDPDVVIRPTGTSWQLDERHTLAAHELHPDLAVLLTTSGTTGAPKLVRLSLDNLQANAASIATYLNITEADRGATTLPMHYSYGLSVINSHLHRGAALILTGLSVVDACFWELFQAHGGTTFAGVPYTFDQLDRVGFDQMRLPSLRYVTQAGGRLAPAQVVRYAELGRRAGWQLFVMYGQTEATARMAYLPPGLATAYPQTVGVPIPGGSFALSPTPGAGPGVGELVYSGPNVMLGYAESPADLALGRTVDVLHTGDLARKVGDLYEIVGRRSRIAKIFGLRIDLEHAEKVLADHSVTAWCADGGDHLVVAAPAAHHGNTHDLLHRHLGLPPNVVRICAVDDPPRLASGKPDYAAIRALGAEVGPAAGQAAGSGISTSGTPGLSRTAELRQLYAQLLNRSDVTDDSTFVSLGGDSLSYVEMSIRLEETLGTLPAGWHTIPIRDLVPRGRRWPRWRQVETTVALRAAAIIAIVGTHTELFTLRGGAHALMAVVGFNLGRFHLSAARRTDRVRRMLASVGRIVVPSVVWIAAVAVITQAYAPTTVALLNSVLGPEGWSQERHFWFIESVVYILLAMTLLLAVPLVNRAERAWPFWFPVTLVGVGLLSRYDIIPLGGSTQVGDAHMVFWLFALGWATAKATTWWHRLLISALVAVTVPGFFDDDVRGLVVIATVLLMVWVPTVLMPALLARLSAVLAGASLYIYLTHWQVYPLIFDRSPFFAVLASMAVGIAYWNLTTWVVHRRTSWWTSRRGRSRQAARTS